MLGGGAYIVLMKEERERERERETYNFGFIYATTRRNEITHQQLLGGRAVLEQKMKSDK